MSLLEGFQNPVPRHVHGPETNTNGTMLYGGRLPYAGQKVAKKQTFDGTREGETIPGPAGGGDRFSH